MEVLLPVVIGILVLLIFVLLTKIWFLRRVVISEPALKPECEACCFLPDCTAFRKPCCPVQVAACRTQMELRTKRELLTLLKRKEETEAEPEQDEADCECL